MNPRQSVREMLAELQDSQARLMAYQYVGLSEIQRAVGIGELFDTLVVFENYPIDPGVLESDASGLRISCVENHDVTHYPLCLAVIPGTQLQLRLQYRPDLLERATVERLCERLVRLLEAVASDPHQPIGAVQLLSQAEREQVLRLWNQTTHEVPRSTLPELFEAQVLRSAQDCAVLFQDQSLSYRELNQRANQLAHELIARGIGPESIVALALPRSLDLIIALLAVLKAGAAYLPLDPNYPPERVAFMLRDAQPALLITTEALAADFENERTPLLCLDLTLRAALAPSRSLIPSIHCGPRLPPGRSPIPLRDNGGERCDCSTPPISSIPPALPALPKLCSSAMPALPLWRSLRLTPWRSLPRRACCSCPPPASMPWSWRC